MLRVLGIIVLLGVYIASIIDVVRTPSLQVRRLPTFVWLLIVLLLPVVGGAIWWIFGAARKPRRSGARAPEDDPRALKEIGDEAWRQRMRKMRESGEPKD